MKTFSIREVIEQAVQTEKRGYEFYSSMSEKHKWDIHVFPSMTFIVRGLYDPCACVSAMTL